MLQSPGPKRRWGQRLGNSLCFLQEQRKHYGLTLDLMFLPLYIVLYTGDK